MLFLLSECRIINTICTHPIHSNWSDESIKLLISVSNPFFGRQSLELCPRPIPVRWTRTQPHTKPGLWMRKTKSNRTYHVRRCGKIAHHMFWLGCARIVVVTHSLVAENKLRYDKRTRRRWKAKHLYGGPCLWCGTAFQKGNEKIKLNWKVYV